ncbi:MAG: RNA polymerase sigma factor RpoD/SigA [Spirochaetia bacterium]|nr:RNA polymerase sigma factor RpoD/SigA [Spirochaetia bacterium]
MKNEESVKSKTKIKAEAIKSPVEETIIPGEEISDDVPPELVDNLAEVLAEDASSASGEEKLDEFFEVDVKKHTHMESSIQWYLEEINKIPLLTRAEEDLYARQTIAGDEKAKDKLITANLRFVVQVAKKYQKYGISLLDLINEGNMGLIKAAERFDPDMGFHFISYAVWWIRQAIILAINQKVSIIRLPMNRTIDLHRIEKVQKELENNMGVEPTLDQIAERLDLPVEEVKWLKQISADYVSLDAPLGNDSDNTQISTIEDDKYESPETEAMNKALHDAINLILVELTVSERAIIEYRFGLNGKQRISLTQAGKKFNLSKERVRQIEKKTLLKLQKYGHKKELEAFLPGR